jgi:oligopeptide/dipeptide ABC transporter ATP-binding protein
VTGNPPPDQVLGIEDLNITVHDGAATAVRGISLAVHTGEIVGLVGESGSGKTLTCRAALGVLPKGCAIEQGTISFEGKDVTQLSPRGWQRLHGSGIGAVFQDPSSYLTPSLTVGSQVAEVLRVKQKLTRRAAHDKTLELFTAVGLRNPALVFHQIPAELSGGMLQRVMIGAALLTRPRLLLADEPTTALDVTTQAEVMAILDELRRSQGLSLLFITHDLELAAAICDRTAVMYAGQIVEDRSSDRLHDDPLHPYTAALTAARPDISRTRLRLRTIPGRPLSAFEAPSSGCAFAPRGPHAADECRSSAVPLTELDGGTTRCVRAGELRGRLEVADA